MGRGRIRTSRLSALLWERIPSPTPPGDDCQTPCDRRQTVRSHRETSGSSCGMSRAVPHRLWLSLPDVWQPLRHVWQSFFHMKKPLPDVSQRLHHQPNRPPHIPKASLDVPQPSRDIRKSSRDVSKSLRDIPQLQLDVWQCFFHMKKSLPEKAQGGSVLRPGLDENPPQGRKCVVFHGFVLMLGGRRTGREWRMDKVFL